jgi:adenylate cyclase class 2
MYEIEIKAHVDDRAKVIKNLERFADFAGAVEKDDSYYENNINGKTIKIRIRKESPFTTKEIPDAPQALSHKSVIFTYKRKELLEDAGRSFEVNDEKETFLTEAEPFEAFLEDTGFKSTLTKHKIVLAWHYDNAHLELCTVDKLGDFIEIEILSEHNDEKQVNEAREKLLKLLSKCGVTEDKIEKRYYSQMLSELKGEK